MAIMALAGGLAKGIATKALVKKPKINAAKFAGKVEDTKAKATPKPGGSLVPSPGGSIVKIIDVKVDPEKKVKVEGDDPLIREVSIVYQRTIDIQKALRNEQKAKKKRATKKLKADEKKKRNLKERLSELAGGAGKAVMGVASKAMAPAGGFFNNLLQGISMLFLGWLTNHLPKILGFAERVVNAISTVGKFLSPIIGFVWDALKWITVTGVSWIAKLTGVEDADSKTIFGNLAELQKKIPLIEAAFAAFIISDAIGAIMDVVDTIRDWRENSRLWRKTRVLRRRIYRSITTPGMRRAIRNRVTRPLGNLTRRVTSIKPREFIKQKGTQLLKGAQQRGTQLLKGVQQSKFGQRAGQLWKNIRTAKPGPSIFQRMGSGLTRARKAIISGGQWLGSKVLNIGMRAINASKGMVGNFIKGAQAKLAKVGAGWTKLKDLGKAQAEKFLKTKLKPLIDPLIQKNPTIKKLLTGLTQKNASGTIQKLFTQVAKNPNTKKLLSFLKKVKGTPGLGPMEILINSIIGAVQYTALGESPINVIVKLIGGMAGYAGGLAVATAIPGWGQSGIGNLLGGMAGAWLGDKAADLVLAGLGKIDFLTTTPDPIMGSADEKAGKPPRPLLRAPGSELIETEEQKKARSDALKDEPEGDIKVKGNGEKSNDASQISESASYDTKGGHGTGGITPVPIEQMTGGGGGGNGGSNQLVATGVNKHEVARTVQKTKDLAKLASE